MSSEANSQESELCGSSPKETILQGRQNLRELFFEASRFNSRSEQEAWLASACPENQLLQEQVLQLLLARERSDQGAWLDQCVDDAASHREELLGKAEGDQEVFEDSSRLPRQIDDYLLEQEIGRGGMSVVYRAVQTDPFKRTVAIKVLLRFGGGDNSLLRFRGEQQILARLQHPGIATIFDSGTTEVGEVYLVMELVDGLSITNFCDQYRLGLQQRLTLIIQLCEAIAYAHQQGVIHRDLKPSNVLVFGDDEEFRVKIIDFGVAKVMHDSMQHDMSLTGTRQIIGTPLYMSPEQMQPGGQSVDTLSDIYSIGCVLYQILVGHAPFDDRRKDPSDFAELQRLVCSDERPVRPTKTKKASRSLYQSDDQRGRGVSRLFSKDLDRELDWIVMKTLEKEKSRRYQSADALADDLTRYLRRQPVAAGPPSFAYIFGKFLARNRALASLAALLIIGLLSATFFSWRQMQLARHAAEVADQRLVQVESARTAAEQQRQAAREAEKVAREAQLTAASARQESLVAWEKAYRESYLAEMRLASEAVQTGELSLAQRLLHNQIPDSDEKDLRGIEWWLLRDLLERKPYWTFDVLQPIVEMAITLDEELVAVSTHYGAVHIVSVKDGQPMLRIRAGFRQSGLAWDPIRRHLAMGGDDGVIRVGRLNQTAVEDEEQNAQWLWEELRKFSAHRGYVSTLAYTPDGERLISSGKDRTIRMWDTKEWNQVTEMKQHQGTVQEITVSPDGHFMASAGNDRQVYLWALPNLELLDSWEMKRRVVSVTFSPDNQMLAAGDIGGNLTLVNLETSQVYSHRSLDGVEKLRLGEQEGRLVLGDAGGKLQTFSLRNVDGVDLLRPLHDQKWIASSDRIKAVAALVDGSILSGDRKGKLSRWIDSSSARSRVIDAEYLKHGAICMPSQWELLVAGPNPQWWNLRTGTSQPWSDTPLENLDLYGNYVICTAPAGNRLVWASDEKLAVYCLNSRLTIQEWEIPHLPHRLAVSPDGERVAVSFHELPNQAFGFQVGSSESIAQLGVRLPMCLKFSPDGQQIAVGHLNDLRIYRWGDDSPILMLQGHDSTLNDCLFLENPSRIVTCSADRSLKIWEAHSGDLLQTVEAHADSVSCLAVSLDGRRVTSGSMDRTIRVWETETWRQLLVWPRFNPILHVAFCAEDNGIAVQCEGNRLLVLLTDHCE